MSFTSTTVPMATGLAVQEGAGAGIFLGGLVIGPSLGHFYAGGAGRGLATIALRAGVSAIGLYALVPCFDD